MEKGIGRGVMQGIGRGVREGNGMEKGGGVVGMDDCHGQKNLPL